MPSKQYVVKYREVNKKKLSKSCYFDFAASNCLFCPYYYLSAIFVQFAEHERRPAKVIKEMAFKP